MSLRRKASNSAGVIVIRVAPWRAHSLAISGRAMVSLIVALSWFTIGCGVPAGAMMPSQRTTSKPGAASAIVGTSGSTSL
jgi:hypothetical protein